MKKLFYISILILLFASTTILFLQAKSGQLEKVTIQTELYPMRVIETNGQPDRTLWVQAKSKKAKTISFYADATTLDAILAKLKSTNKN